MALRTVVKYGDSILRQKSRPVDSFDKKLAELLDDMIETMDKEEGAGLAAVQVGILKRVAVVKNGGVVYELINPVIIKSEGEVCDSEGCLSIPGRRADIRRPKTVTVRTYDRKGKIKEFTVREYTARAVCHEMDHMDGVLFIDRIETPAAGAGAVAKKGGAAAKSNGVISGGVNLRKK